MLSSKFHSSSLSEVLETLRMVEVEHLDIRTVTLGISLFDLAGTDARLPERVFERITTLGRNLVDIGNSVQSDLGVPVVNKRVSVSPIGCIAHGDEEQIVDVARALDEAAKEIGIDYIGGFSALVHKGMTHSEQRLLNALPKALASTERMCASVNAATTKAGINMDAVAILGHKILETAALTADQDGIGCAKFVAFANAVEDNPFIAGAMHGIGEPAAVLNVGISGPGVVHHALRRLMDNPPRDLNLSSVAEVIKRMSFKTTRAGELVGRVVAAKLGAPVEFGVVDLSLAPTPAEGDSVADILQTMGLERVGAHGTTAALLLLTDAVKKGGLMASSSVGGLSGAFIPVSEDRGMIDAVRLGALSLDKLEAMTSICSVGLDMVAIPGDTPPEVISGILADQMAIGVMNSKTTAARLLPIPGSKPGDIFEWGGLLGDAIVMDVNTFSPAQFIGLGGKIPAPVHGYRN